MHTEKLSESAFMVIDKISNLRKQNNMGLSVKNSEGFWVFKPLTGELLTWQLIDIAQTIGEMNQKRDIVEKFITGSNYASKELRKLWPTFDSEQRAAIGKALQEVADSEEWD